MLIRDGSGERFDPQMLQGAGGVGSDGDVKIGYAEKSLHGQDSSLLRCCYKICNLFREEKIEKKLVEEKMTN